MVYKLWPQLHKSDKWMSEHVRHTCWACEQSPRVPQRVPLIMGEGPLSHIFCGGTALENEPLGFYGCKALAVLREKGRSMIPFLWQLFLHRYGQRTKPREKYPKMLHYLPLRGMTVGHFPAFILFCFARFRPPTPSRLYYFMTIKKQSYFHWIKKEYQL